MYSFRDRSGTWSSPWNACPSRIKQGIVRDKGRGTNKDQDKDRDKDRGEDRDTDGDKWQDSDKDRDTYYSTILYVIL